MTITAEDQIIHHLKDRVGLAEADRLVAELKGEAHSLRDRLDVIVTDELGTPSPVLVSRLADLIDEARIRAKQDAQHRATKVNELRESLRANRPEPIDDAPLREAVARQEAAMRANQEPTDRITEQA